MTIACGPFTHDSDLIFKPWSSLLKSLQLEEPGVILLVCVIYGVQARLLTPLIDRTIHRLEQ